jgi:hypothetical protein
MEPFLMTLVWGFTALLAVAVLVALWEHGHAQRRDELPPVDAHRAFYVDVDLDHMPLPNHGDQAEREAALGGAIGRMSSAPVPAKPSAASGWTETQPMVAPSLTAEEPRS